MRHLTACVLLHVIVMTSKWILRNYFVLQQIQETNPESLLPKATKVQVPFCDAISILHAEALILEGEVVCWS